MRPQQRTLIISLSAIVALAVVVALWFSLRERQSTAESVVVQVPRIKPSLPGEPLPPHIAEVWQQAEQDWLIEAEEQGDSAVPTLTALESLQQPKKLPPKALLPAVPNPEPEADLQQENRQRQQQASHKLKALNSLLASWKPHTHTSQDATLEWQPVDEPVPSDSPTDSENESQLINAQTLHYAMVLTEVNSDEPGPVLADIVNGPLQGGRLLGRFTRRDEKLVLSFDQLTLAGHSQAIDAIAVDPVSYRQGLATDVNRRTFSRWAALLGSAFLQGLQRALLAERRIVDLGDAVTVEQDFNGDEIAGIVIGEVGPRTRSAAQQYFNRPPTVTINSGTGIGVLFLQPVSFPQAALKP